MKMNKSYSSLHTDLVIKYFWQVIRNFKFSFFTIIIASVFTAILDVYIPFQFLSLWNILSSNNFEFVTDAENIIIFILILGLIRWFFRRVVGFTNSYFQSSVMAGLRVQAFSNMLNHSHSFFADNFGGSLTQKVSKYARAFEKLMDRLVNDGLPLLVKSIGTVYAIYTLNSKYALILTIFIIIFLSTAFIYTKYKLKYDIISALADTKTTGEIADSISNHPSIQLFSGYEYEKNKISSVVEEQKKKTLFNWYLWEGLGAIQALYFLIMEFIVFWIAIKDWQVGLITLPVIVLIQVYIGRVTENLWSFAHLVRIFYDGFADAQEMAIILNTPFGIKNKNIKEIGKVEGEIFFDQITYLYESNKIKVFDNFSLKIKKGEKVAIVGYSGAGKSTFVKLLMRLFNLSKGKIFIDGIDISEISQEKLREQIGFVPQDPLLFHRTLMENIRYGKRDATDTEVIRASELAHCTEFIKKLPLGFNTYVGERGIKLSGGERQRVAIARAILKNSPILVLDEATSALDSESESLIQDAIHNLIKGKTLIVIAHRLSTIRNIDRIIVIDNGKIVEEGNHEELISIPNGIYKKLWDIQSGGFKI